MNKAATRIYGTRYFMYMCLIAGVALPGIGYFRDDPLTAQWFYGWATFILIILYETYQTLYRQEKGVCRIEILGNAAALVTVYECSFVFIEMFTAGGQPAGTMDNATGLALYLSLLLPFIVGTATKGKPKKKTFLIITAAAATITIMATGCRTAMICIAVTAILYFHHNCKQFRSPKIITAVTVTIITLAFVLGNYKQESTTGRWFILKNTTELIKEEPIEGYSGTGGFEKVYMDKQAEYFKENGEDIYAILADEVRHPLNEFLYIWVDYGIGGLFLFIASLVFPTIVFYRRKSFLGQSIPATLLIFSMFSYPLQYPLANIALLLCNAIALLSLVPARIKSAVFRRGAVATFVVAVMLIGAQMNLLYHFYYHCRWSEAAYRAARGENREMLPELEMLYPHFSQETFYLYNYMAELYFAGELDKALEVSEELHRYMSSYNLELLTGDILFGQGRYSSAINHYRNAAYMCPNRFAPLEGLYKCYKNTNDYYNRDAIAEIILHKKVKIPSRDVLRIKSECK